MSISSWKNDRDGFVPCQYIGHYQVEYPLSLDAICATYVAQDTKKNREVELRFPTEAIGYDPVAYEHLQRESKSGEMLTHANIQKLYGPGGCLTREATHWRSWPSTST